MHPVANFVVAKALERAQAEQLSYALNELRDSLGRLRRKWAPFSDQLAVLIDL